MAIRARSTRGSLYPSAGNRLIMNGDPNQTFPHLHFHLGLARTSP